jgi:hypothetical protein
MNKLVVSVIVMLTSAAHAADKEKAPTPFQDSKIERVLSDGKVQKFDGNEYEIVKRHKKVAKAKPKPLPVEVCKQEPAPKEVEVIQYVYRTEQIPPKKNDVSLLVGYGPVGLQRDDSDGVEAVNFKRDIVGGLQYQRLLYPRDLRLQISVLTNKSLIGGIGLDF